MTYRHHEDYASPPMAKRELIELIGIIAGAWALVGIGVVLLCVAAKAMMA